MHALFINFFHCFIATKIPHIIYQNVQKETLYNLIEKTENVNFFYFLPTLNETNPIHV